MRILTYRATEQDAGKRVETALMGRLQVSRGLLSRLKRREDGICVNGQRVYATYVLKAGDLIAADVGDHEPPRHLEPVEMDLSAVYEDEDLLVVSRLDKGTTGLMLVAKSGYMHELMKRRLHTDAFCREYLAVAEGIVAPPSGVIDAPIGLADGSSYRHEVQPDGARSLTQYETLSTADGRTLLHLLPKTGRTHQLRVHMAHLGYPLTGDWLYGTRSEAIDRPALHSHRLVFLHPLTGERIECLSPLPPDMQRLIP